MSSALGRFTASLLAGSQETTVALAALNFDFSLYKVEAPAEYQALGSCLSEERRKLAENGSHHITARKLGAIFRSKIPKVPNLIRAYGERVSEIAKSPSLVAEAESVRGIHSLFADKIGIDGTSIWAAATSGNEAICVQLLACILARFWPSPEAVSIWSEILERRKLELSRSEDEFDFPQIAAMQANVTRDQLAEWDASARAWIRSADAVKNKQQTQLRLIIDNVDVHVNTAGDTYDSVMEAWIMSMVTIDNLISGAPQSIHQGAALVGLSAWHLYPDMIVYRDYNTEIVQYDRLFRAGGLLTVGLKLSNESDKGVKWSLPLAKLRFYGDPVLVTKSMDSRSSRISFKQLASVALGCLARQWPDISQGYEIVCKYYSLLSKRRKRTVVHVPLTWISYIGDAASRFLESHGDDRRSLKRLMDFGLRRCPDFLDVDKNSITSDMQLFFMADIPKFLSNLPTTNLRLSYIRTLIHRHTIIHDSESWIIVYASNDDYHLATVDPSASHNFGCTPSIKFERGMATGSRAKECDILVCTAHKMDVPHLYSFYDLVLGEPSSAALYRRFGCSRKDRYVLPPSRVEMSDILDALDNNEIREKAFDSFNSIIPLRALGYVGNLYESPGAATISMEVTSSPLVSRQWLRTSMKLPGFRGLTRPQALSCIVLMETGDQDLNPSLLDRVMAISSGDSIYAARSLICDPYSQPYESEIVRSVGNIGKPGVSLLVSPPHPRVRKSNVNEWNLITHDVWDGTRQNSLGSTSLHLSLTDYRIPCVVRHEGAQDSQAYFQEAVVSIYDRNIWVGDVDILKSLSKDYPNIIKVPIKCPYHILSPSTLLRKKSSTINHVIINQKNYLWLTMGSFFKSVVFLKKSRTIYN